MSRSKTNKKSVFGVEDSEDTTEDNPVGDRDVPEVIESSEDDPIRIFVEEEDMPDEYYVGT